MKNDLLLCPAPRKMKNLQGEFDHSCCRWVRIDPRISGEFRGVLSEITAEFSIHFPRPLELIAGTPSAGEIFLELDLVAGKKSEPQSYSLKSGKNGVMLSAGDEAGIFYGLQTLRQIVSQRGSCLPVFEIEDWPDFASRGVMLDISRCKVPTMKTLFDMVKMLSSLKINHLELYMEHSFAFTAHEAVWYDASPLTSQEVMELDAFCKKHFVELVPNFNSFGHLERWLRHPEYRYLAECPDGFAYPWGDKCDHGSILRPSKEALAFLDSLYGEFLPNFSSSLFNIGCDETWELGQGFSRKSCDKKGKTRVYLDFLIEIDKLVKRNGRRTMFWGDIILHEPSLIKELPRDIVALNWGYEANHPFEKESELFAESGIEFHVCPGTSSWNSLTGRTTNCLANLASAARNGARNGAAGFLITDWGDGGHHQYAPISYMGFTAGAAYSWSYDASKDLDIADVMDRMIFKDSASILGGLLSEMGKVLELVKNRPANASVFNKLLFWNMDEKAEILKDTTPAALKKTVEKFDELESRLTFAKPEIPDASLVKSELANNIAMARHGARRGIAFFEKSDRTALRHELQKIIRNHEELWLARNRLGGLRESSGRLRDFLSACV